MLPLRDAEQMGHLSLLRPAQCEMERPPQHLLLSTKSPKPQASKIAAHPREQRDRPKVSQPEMGLQEDSLPAPAMNSPLVPEQDAPEVFSPTPDLQPPPQRGLHS